MQISRRPKTTIAFLPGLWPEGLVLSLSLWLYTFQLGQESLWIDEMLSLGSAAGPLDLNRPLYFILLRGWMRVSQDESWLRLLSVLFGISCVVLTYALARQLINRKTALVAALLLSLSPLAINHTQEVRYYMMSTCLGVAGTLCLCLAIQSLQRFKSDDCELNKLSILSSTQRPSSPNPFKDTVYLSLGSFMAFSQVWEKGYQSGFRSPSPKLGKTHERTKGITELCPKRVGVRASGSCGSHLICDPKSLNSKRLKAQKPKILFLLGWILFRSLGFLTVQPNLLLIVPDLSVISWQALTNYRTRASITSSRLKKRRIGYRWPLALGLLMVPMIVIAQGVLPPLVEFLHHQRWYAGAVSRPNVLNLLGLLSALTAWPLQGPEQLDAGFYKLLFSLYAIVTFLLLAGVLFAHPLLPASSLSGVSRDSFLQWRDRSRLFYLALWGLLPIAIIFGLSQIFPFLWLERYSLVAVPYVLILLAAGWMQLWTTRRRLAVLVAALYFLCVGSALTRYYTADYHADWRGLTSKITQQEQPGDTVIVYPGSLLPYIAHYYQGRSTLVPIEEVEVPADVNADSFVDDVQTMASTNKRFWLVCPIQDDWSQAIETVSKQLEVKGFSLTAEEPFVNHWNWGPTLYLFEQPSVL